MTDRDNGMEGGVYRAEEPDEMEGADDYMDEEEGDDAGYAEDDDHEQDWPDSVTAPIAYGAYASTVSPDSTGNGLAVAGLTLGVLAVFFGSSPTVTWPRRSGSE